MIDPTITIDPRSHRTTFSISGIDLAPTTSVLHIDLGYQNTTDSFLESDPPRPEELSAALSVIELHLDDVARELTAERNPDDGTTPFDRTVRRGMVAGGGPIFATLAAVEIGLDPFDPELVDGFELTRAAVEDVFRTIATEPLADRLHNPGLTPEWADVIVGGACVIVEAYRCWDLGSITVTAPAGVARR